MLGETQGAGQGLSLTLTVEPGCLLRIIPWVLDLWGALFREYRASV